MRDVFKKGAGSGEEDQDYGFMVGRVVMEGLRAKVLNGSAE